MMWTMQRAALYMAFCCVHSLTMQQIAVFKKHMSTILTLPTTCRLSSIWRQHDCSSVGIRVAWNRPTTECLERSYACRSSRYPTETLLYSSDKQCQCWQIVVTYLPMCMTWCSRSYFMVLETDEIIVSLPLIWWMEQDILCSYHGLVTESD